MADILASTKDAANAVSTVSKNIGTITSAVSKTSLVRLTKDQVFQFPLFMEADIDDDEKFPMIKSIEKNYAALVMMAIVNNGFVDRGRFGDINKFLRQFHNNGDLPFNASESLMSGNFDVTEAIATEGYGSVYPQDLLAMWGCVEEQLDTSSINEMYLPFKRTANKLNRVISAAMEASSDEYFRTVEYKRQYGKDPSGKVTELLIKDKQGNPMVETDKDGNPKYVYIKAPTNPVQRQKMINLYGQPRSASLWRDDNLKSRIGEYQNRKDIDQKIWEEQQRQLNARKDSDRTADNAEWDRRHGIERTDRNKDTTDEYDRRHAIERGEQLNDLYRREKQQAFGNTRAELVKDDKYNSLTPTILNMTLANGKEGVGAWSQQLIIGVRAMPRMLPQSLMVANMVEAVKSRPIFKFIKWVKGEINWADLFTGIGTARKEVNAGGARWLKVLRKRAKMSKLRWLGFKLNPNCTIIITETDAHLVKEQTGVDLHKVDNVQKLMNTYFLLGFGIYDSEAKMLNIIYDGESDFSQQSLRSMIADTKKDANLLAMGRY